MSSIKEIFDHTRTIAVIGLSPDQAKPSHRVAKYLQEQGFRIIPIYPKGDEILGERVYTSLDEVGDHVDMAVMFRKGEYADELIEMIAKRDDIRTLWLQLGITNDAALTRARAMGLAAVQDRCAMIEYQKLERL
jgi:predicted CoA-binding protein